MKNLKSTVLLSLFALVMLGCSRTPPSDKSMEEKFRAHKADFQRLVEMFKEDANLGSVDGIAAYLPRDEAGNQGKTKIPPARMDEYRRLLNKTGLKKLLRRDEGIYLLLWSGWYSVDPTNSQSKDYLYAETPPSPLTESLDQTEDLPIDGSSPEIYKKIADNWYLEYTRVD